MWRSWFRTDDAGIHAEGDRQYSSESAFTPESSKTRSTVIWKRHPHNEAEKPDEFHPVCGEKKTYVYRVVNAPVMSPFWRRFAHHEARPLDVGRMNDVARLFLGEHDWTAFSSAQADGDNRVRTVTDFTVESRWDDRAGAAMIEFRISAHGFLRYMVRSIVGTMLEVGRGEKDSDTIQTAIVTGNRDLAGKTASAAGLTLFKVDYSRNADLSHSSSRRWAAFDSWAL